MAQALLSALARSGGFIIPDEKGDGPLPPWSVNDQSEIVRRASGVVDLNVHDLRHAFATRGAGLGASAVSHDNVLGVI
jgi:integrase